MRLVGWREFLITLPRRGRGTLLFGRSRPAIPRIKDIMIGHKDGPAKGETIRCRRGRRNRSGRMDLKTVQSLFPGQSSLRMATVYCHPENGAQRLSMVSRRSPQRRFLNAGYKKGVGKGSLSQEPLAT